MTWGKCRWGQAFSWRFCTICWGFTSSLHFIPFQKTGNFARFSSHRWGRSLHIKILKKLGVFGVILHAPNQKSQNEGCLLQETIIFSAKQIDFKTISPFFDTAKWVLQQHSRVFPWSLFYRIGSAAALKLCQSPSGFFFRPILKSHFCCFWHCNLVGWTLKEKVSSKFQGSWRRCA